jgi:hypothetical protein
MTAQFILRMEGITVLILKINNTWQATLHVPLQYCNAGIPD